MLSKTARGRVFKFIQNLKTCGEVCIRIIAHVHLADIGLFIVKVELFDLILTALVHVDGVLVLTQNFTEELNEAAGEPEMLEEEQKIGDCFMIDAYSEGPFCVALQNEQGEELRFGVDDDNCLYIDRTNAGIADFFAGFAQVLSTPRLQQGFCRFTAVYDVAGLEITVDDGTLNYAVQVFPKAPYTTLCCADVEGTISELK